jgi:hydroxymethylbilane synthase
MKPSVRARPSRALPLRLGTRGSALALAQANWVAKRLKDEVELVEIGTQGAVGDKSRFVKAIEEALLAGEVDLAVHSAKDVPGELPPGLAIVGVPERADPFDALCGLAELAALAEGAVVGTASVRRKAQLLAARPDLDVRELHGNVDTRLKRLAAGDFDAIVLARAGLDRLGRGDEGSPLTELVPAPGQGCLALEARADDEPVITAATALTDREALTALTAERALVAALGATCNTPIGAHARFAGEGHAQGGAPADGPADAAGRLRLTAFVGLPDGSHWIRDQLDGDASEPAALGRAVAQRLVAAGARELLEEAERAALDVR